MLLGISVSSTGTTHGVTAQKPQEISCWQAAMWSQRVQNSHRVHRLVHLFVPFSKTWGQPQKCVACCFKMGLCRNASSHAHSTTLFIHCIELQSTFSTCAQHWAQFLLLIAILKHVHGLSRHQLISLCCRLFCVSITVVHQSCTVQHLSLLLSKFAGAQSLNVAFAWSNDLMLCCVFVASLTSTNLIFDHADICR